MVVYTLVLTVTVTVCTVHVYYVHFMCAEFHLFNLRFFASVGVLSSDKSLGVIT